MPILRTFDRYAIVNVIGARGAWAVNEGVLGAYQQLVRASVKKTISSSPNVAQVSIANLGKDKLALLNEDRPLADDFATPFAFLDEKVARVPLPSAEANSIAQNLGYLRLRAGHSRLPPTIFEGTIEQVDTNRRSVHTPVTTIRVRDGGFQTRDAYANKVFPWQTPLRAVVKYLVRTLGLEHDEASFTAAGLDTAKVASSADCTGNPYPILRQIARGFGVGFFIDDGTVVWMRPDGFRGVPPLVVTPGELVDKPIRKGGTVWQIRMNLRTFPVLGARVLISTPSLSGTLRCDGIAYNVQNRGGTFQAVVDLRNLDPFQTLLDTSGALSAQDQIGLEVLETL